MSSLGRPTQSPPHAQTSHSCCYRSDLNFSCFHIVSISYVIVYFCQLSIYLYTLAVSPSLGGSRQHKRNNKNKNKTMGISLRSSSNDEGPSRVWMALLEQHSPSSPVFHNLHRLIDAISLTAPTTGLLL